MAVRFAGMKAPAKQNHGTHACEAKPGNFLPAKQNDGTFACEEKPRKFCLRNVHLPAEIGQFCDPTHQKQAIFWKGKS